MAGNSKRRGAIRKDGTKKGMVVGSGGQRRRGIEERADPAQGGCGRVMPRSAANRRRRGHGKPTRGGRSAPPGQRRRPGDGETPETVLGRTRARMLRRGSGHRDARRVGATSTSGSPKPCTSRRTLASRSSRSARGPGPDRRRCAAPGHCAAVPPYEYAHPHELLELGPSPPPRLSSPLDGVPDPRNLGAVAAVSARSAAMEWWCRTAIRRHDRGRLADLGRGCGAPAGGARDHLTRTLREYATAGFMVAGLDTEGSVSPTTSSWHPATGAGDRVRGQGLSRLVKQTCDVTVSIPMSGPVESLKRVGGRRVVLAEVAGSGRLRHNYEGRTTEAAGRRDGQALPAVRGPDPGLVIGITNVSSAPPPTSTVSVTTHCSTRLSPTTGRSPRAAPAVHTVDPPRFESR